MNDFFETNKHLKNLPKHLLQYVVDQEYDQYTPVDHSVWRYVMRQNLDYLPKVIFGNYYDGLKQAGITINKIPNLYGMNRILQDVGWAAVCVDGFIPPKAFMEFQAHKVLVIAADIRQVNHIEYTPAPDILHEAAGHAPIIPNKKYSNYLQLFGQIGTKAFSSFSDSELFEAIRTLSILKEAPGTSKIKINKAEEKVNLIQDRVKQENLSEMSMIRNLHWWTVEYGLIGTVSSPKIYGAGLLSSIGESVWCMSKEVIKKPYNIDASKVNFDITKPQPQLFVTPDFDYLINVLEEFSENMAFKKGGNHAINQAINYAEISTCEYETGVQVSGKVVQLIKSGKKGIYFRTEGLTALSYLGSEIKNHSTNFHREGFGAPLGKVINYDLSNLTSLKAKSLGLLKGSDTYFKYDSGIELNGRIENFVLNENNDILLISFSNCDVVYKNTLLFNRNWGQYDLIMGEKITSCFPGFADIKSNKQKKYNYTTNTIKPYYTDAEKTIQKLYQKVSKIRENELEHDELKNIFNNLKDNLSQDWLLLLEICELSKGIDVNFFNQVQSYLMELSSERKDLGKLISNGLKIL